MHEICTFLIKVRNQVDVEAFNVSSPHQVAVTQVEAAATLLTICTDQAGLIGLLRHLHQQRYVLISVCRRQPVVCEPNGQNNHTEKRKEKADA